MYVQLVRMLTHKGSASRGSLNANLVSTSLMDNALHVVLAALTVQAPQTVLAAILQLRLVPTSAMGNVCLAPMDAFIVKVQRLVLIVVILL